MDRVRRIANEMVKKYDASFSTNFEVNKKAFDELMLVRSKQLRNEIVGFITKIKNRESNDDTQNMLPLTVSE